jgi:hypothetical protein
MIIRKVTIGCVIQNFDTDKNQFISQEFKANDIVFYELEDGTPCLPITIKKIEKYYLPYEMKQPNELSKKNKSRKE